MAYVKRDVKDRVAEGDDIFLVEELGDNKIKLTPSPTKVTEVGTLLNKAHMQPIEDALYDHDRKITWNEKDISDIKLLYDYTFKDSLLNFVHPIGSVYMSVNPTNPSILFGGTWSQIQDRFLIGASTTYPVNTTGGNTRHFHHINDGDAYGKLKYRGDYGWFHYAHVDVSPNWSCPSTQGHVGTIGFNASGKPLTEDKGLAMGGSTNYQDALPPYLAVYMWKRTA